MRPLIWFAIILVCAGAPGAGPAMGQSDWDAGGGTDIRWFLDLNWNPDALPATGDTTRDLNGSATGAITRVLYAEHPDQNATFVDPGIGSFQARAPSNAQYTFRLEPGAGSNTLTTTGDTQGNANFWHDGQGSYIIRIQDSSLRVGDPSGPPFPFGGPFDADLYGFTTDFKGTPPEAGACGATVQASRTVGWGPLSVIDGCGVILAGVGDLFFTGQVAGGTIDCSYQLPTGLTPITGSRWEIDDLLSGAGSSLTVVASRITQIGDWDFIPSVDLQEFRTFIGISTNTLEMYPEHGTLQIHRTRIDIANNTAPAPDAAPTATFDGSSELIHTPAGFSDSLGWFFTYVNPPNQDSKALMSFLGRPSLLRPSAARRWAA